MNMKVQLNHLASSFLVFFLASLLAACGGSSGSDSQNYSVNLSQNSIEFVHEAGTSSEQTISVNVTYSGEGLLVGIPPDGNLPSWLNYRVAELGQTTARIEFSLANEDSIGPNNYDAQVRISTGDVANNNYAHSDLTINFNVWQLSINDTPVSLTSTRGYTETDTFDVRLIAANTNWTVSSDLDWLSFDMTSGEGTGELQTIVATADYSNIEAGGLIEGTVTLTDSTTSSQKSIPVSLALDELHLFSNQSSVAFVKTASTEKLIHTIDISSNAEQMVDWQAATQADWLTLTPSIENNTLTITADPATITAETFATAQINITATTDTNVITQPVAVSIYHSAQTVEDTQTLADTVVNTDGLALHPHAPWFYVASANTVTIYHQYTFDVIETITVAADGLVVENLIITKDANHLFALANETVTTDEGDTTVTHHYHVDLSTNVATQLTDATITGTPVEHFVIDGRDFILTTAFEFADTQLNALYTSPTQLPVSEADFSDGNNALYITVGGTDIFRFTVSVNDFATNKIDALFDQSYTPENINNTGIFDLVVNDQDTTLYLLNADTDWLSYDGENFTDNGKLRPDVNDTSLGLASNQSKTPFYLRFDNASRVFVESFDNNQVQISDTTAVNFLPAIIKVDNSGTRFASYVQELNGIVFYPVTPL